MAKGKIANQPTNTNPALGTNHKLIISRIPNVEYTVQSVSLPNITLGTTTQPSIFGAKLYLPGSTFEYDPLVVKFQVDENLNNWLEIYSWMHSISTAVEQANVTQKESFSDITLAVLTSKKNLNKTFSFTDCFPVSLSGLNFDTTITSPEPLTAEVTFRYVYYKLNT